MSVAGITQEQKKHRKADEIAAIEHGEAITTGTNKTAYRGLRGIVKPMPKEQFPEQNQEKLAESELTAPGTVNERDLTEIGLWKETKVIHQEEADEELEEAVETYGTDFVIEETVENLLDEFTERGIVYEDPGDNIGFFSGQAKAFDVYDDSAFEFKDGNIEEMSEKDFYEFQREAPVMYQKFAEDVANYSQKSHEEVVNKVADTSEYLIEEEASRINFQDAFQYTR